MKVRRAAVPFQGHKVTVNFCDLKMSWELSRVDRSFRSAIGTRRPCISLMQIIALTDKVTSFWDWKEKRFAEKTIAKIADVVSMSTAITWREINFKRGKSFTDSCLSRAECSTTTKHFKNRRPNLSCSCHHHYNVTYICIKAAESLGKARNH